MSNSIFENPNILSDVKKQKTAKQSNKLVTAKPTRLLPILIEDLVKKGFPVQISENNYLIGGFYGLNDTGFATLSEIDLKESGLNDTDNDSMIAFDGKNKPHLIRTFDDLMKFNLMIWKQYYKQPEFSCLDSHWYPFVIQSPYISITPNI